MFCGHLRGEDEVLHVGEAEAHLEGAGGLLLHLDLHDHQILAAAGLVGDLHRLEEAERGDALLAAAHAGAVEELALVDAQLAADHLVAGLGVADDVDALDGDLLALLDVEGEVDGLASRGPCW